MVFMLGSSGWNGHELIVLTLENVRTLTLFSGSDSFNMT